MTADRPAGRVVVVGDDRPAYARRLAEHGCDVVVVGTRPESIAVCVDAARDAGGRAAAFVGSLTAAGARGAVAEMIDELFRAGRRS